MSIPSPCTGVCRIDEASGFCLGCARTISEIKAWGTADRASLERIWAQLPQRRDRLNLGFHRLGWSHDRILAFVVSTMQPCAGTWLIGNNEANGEFYIGPEDRAELQVDGDRVTALTHRGAIRLVLPEDIRVLAFSDTDRTAIQNLTFALPRHRSEVLANHVLTSLGPDRDAIRPLDRMAKLYDLGFGSNLTHSCIRTVKSSLIDALENRNGWPWPRLLSELGSEVWRESHRILLTSIGRFESFTPILALGVRFPARPFTDHFPPDSASKCELSRGIDLPISLRSAAVFHPSVGFNLDAE